MSARPSTALTWLVIAGLAVTGCASGGSGPQAVATASTPMASGSATVNPPGASPAAAHVTPGAPGVTATNSSTGAPGATSANSSGSRPCEVDSLGRPTKCMALWGLASNPPTVQNYAEAENLAGRPFDIVYRFHDISRTDVDDQERAAAARGQLLHISIAATNFGTGKDVSYGDILAGKYDSQLTAQAKAFGTLSRPVFVTFEQEGNQLDKAGTRGTPAEYVAAWRHVHDLMQRSASNLVWVWVMMGGETAQPRTAELWPGNDVVDWISWNVYNKAGCHNGMPDPAKHRNFESVFRPFYDWVHGDGARAGIDATKPMMVSEAGSARYSSNTALTASWYAEIPDVLRRYPQVMALTLFSNESKDLPRCGYRFQNDPEVTAAVKQAGAGMQQPNR